MAGDAEAGTQVTSNLEPMICQDCYMTEETTAVISANSKSLHGPGEMPTPLFPPQASTSSEEFAACFLPENALHITSFLSCQLQKYVALESFPLSFVPDLASLLFL